jgi:hypothetical protein
MTKAIVVAGQTLSTNLRDGAISDKGSLVGVRVFVAGKAGLTKDEVKDMKYSEVKALIESRKLATKDQIKVWDDEYDAHRSRHFGESRQMVSLFVASPEWRNNVKLAYNQKGECIGANATFRKERSTVSLASQLSLARAEIATLRKQLPAALPA